MLLLRIGWQRMYRTSMFKMYSYLRYGTDSHRAIHSRADRGGTAAAALRLYDTRLRLPSWMRSLTDPYDLSVPGWEVFECIRKVRGAPEERRSHAHDPAGRLRPTE